MPSADQMNRLRGVVPYAQTASRRWHVTVSVTLAQWIFESGWGLDDIAVKANNCFGVTHLQANRSEPYMQFKTPDYKKGATKPFYHLVDFVLYDSVERSFDAHGKLLATAARYQPAMAVADDPHAFARQLQLCGYSTAPTYAKSLCNEIDVLGLRQYDLQPPPTVSAGKAA